MITYHKCHHGTRSCPRWYHHGPGAGRRTLIQSRTQERLQYDRVLTIINNLSDATFSTDEKGRNVLMYNACLNLLDTNDNLKDERWLILGWRFLTGMRSVIRHSSEARKTVRRDDISHTYSDGEEIRLG